MPFGWGAFFCRLSEYSYSLGLGNYYVIGYFHCPSGLFPLPSCLTWQFVGERLRAPCLAAPWKDRAYAEREQWCLDKNVGIVPSSSG